MADKDYAPLSTACVRALNDRLYEKRKAAALEIEKMVKDFVSVDNNTQIRKLLKVLGSEFAISQNPHMRFFVCSIFVHDFLLIVTGRVV